MGILDYPTLQRYWSKSWPFHILTFSSIMPRDRFLLILKFLHLNNNEVQVGRGVLGYDPLFKLRPLLTALIPRYQSSYQLHRNISIDESMIGFKGRLSFLQYMPKKPKKWGMKAWVLADSKTAYTWNWMLYTGKDNDAQRDSLATRVVLQLVELLHQSGHHLYFDNFYTSPGKDIIIIHNSLLQTELILPR